jgi:rhodanese-related sulfurtransferase
VTLTPAPVADYAGDLSPTQAWSLLQDEADALLIDVRTDAEWSYVGGPNLATLTKHVLQLSWQIFPQMQVAPDFVEQLCAHAISPTQSLLFLCRSGVRSRHAAAAMTQAGYLRCYNISQGFEGDKDSNGQRGNIGGWKVDGLDWMQP